MSHSGTESAVVLQCLMLLAAFLKPFVRDFSDFLVLLVEISGISLLLLVLINDGLLYPFPLLALIEVFHLFLGLNPWLLFAG